MPTAATSAHSSANITTRLCVINSLALLKSCNPDYGYWKILQINISFARILGRDLAHQIQITLSSPRLFKTIAALILIWFQTFIG